MIQEFIRRMIRESKKRYREDLPENREESESTDSPDDGSSERCREDYEELIREFPEAMELVGERKERKDTHGETITKTRNARADIL